jgi:hypothetical protein
MSRSGYTDESHDDPLALGRWRQVVNNAVRGQRGQALLRELAEALDAMPDKRLWPDSFATADGEFCALGVLGAKRGLRLDDLGEGEECSALVGERFGIAPALAAEIMYLNDEWLTDCWAWVDVEICGPIHPFWLRHRERFRSLRVHNKNHPQERWERMREWVANQLTSNASKVPHV